jgi:hypothetical protein
MMLRRIGIALGAVAATLTLAASAQAATTPVMNPLPAYTCATSVTPSWTPSIPSPGGQIVSYRVDYGDLTTGAAGYKYTSALSTTIGGLINGHQYVVRVRALEYRNGALTYSNSSGRTFKRLCLVIPTERLRQYVAYNPFPECIMCGRLEDILDIEDPVIRKQISVATLPAAERLQGITLEADGSVLFG